MGSILTNDDVFDHDSVGTDLNATHDTDRDAIWLNHFMSPRMMRAFTPRDGIIDRELLWNMDIDFEVLPQVDYSSWDPQADVFTAEPRYAQVQEMKVDLEFYPQKMQRTYFGKFTGPNADQFDMGPYQWLLAHVSDVINKKMHLNAMYLGVYNAAGSTTTDTMDGRNKIIADEITAGNLVPVVTGAITSSNVVDVIEQMCVAHDLSATWGEEPAILPVNPQIFNWYWQKRRSLYSSLVTPHGDLKPITEIQVEGFNVTLINYYGLGTSQRLCITQKSNLNRLFDSENKRNRMTFQKLKRMVNGFIDFREGFNFAYLFDGSTTVNDQA